MHTQMGSCANGVIENPGSRLHLQLAGEYGHGVGAVALVVQHHDQHEVRAVRSTEVDDPALPYAEVTDNLLVLRAVQDDVSDLHD